MGYGIDMDFILIHYEVMQQVGKVFGLTPSHIVIISEH